MGVSIGTGVDTEPTVVSALSHSDSGGWRSESNNDSNSGAVARVVTRLGVADDAFSNALVEMKGNNL